jgi:hypothetical protein
MIAARMANMDVGRPVKAANLPDSVSQPEAAEMLNVSERSVRDAKLIENMQKRQSLELHKTFSPLLYSIWNTQQSIADVVGVHQDTVSDIVLSTEKRPSSEFRKTFSSAVSSSCSVVRRCQ